MTCGSMGTGDGRAAQQWHALQGRHQARHLKGCSAFVQCLCGIVASSLSTTSRRLQRAHAVSAARRGIIEHNISEVARGRRTKEAVLEEAVQHFRGDYRAAALKSGAPLPPACPPPALMDCIPVNRVKRLYRRQSVMSGLPATCLHCSHSAYPSARELGGDVSLVSEGQVPVKRVEGFHRCQRVMPGRPCRRDGGGGGALLRPESRRPGAGTRGATRRRAGCDFEPSPCCSAASEKCVCSCAAIHRLCQQLRWTQIRNAEDESCCCLVDRHIGHLGFEASKFQKRMRARV